MKTRRPEIPLVISGHDVLGEILRRNFSAEKSQSIAKRYGKFSGQSQLTFLDRLALRLDARRARNTKPYDEQRSAR